MNKKEKEEEGKNIFFTYAKQNAHLRAAAMKPLKIQAILFILFVRS